MKAKGWVVVTDYRGVSWPWWHTARELRREAIAEATEYDSWANLRKRGCRVVKARLVEGWE